LNARKNKLRREDFLEYFARDRLGLTERIIDKITTDFANIRPQWEALLEVSFLSDKMKEKYLQVVNERFARIFQ
jgi:serine/threonine-protein kinase HipA